MAIAPVCGFILKGNLLGDKTINDKSSLFLVCHKWAVKGAVWPPNQFATANMG